MMTLLLSKDIRNTEINRVIIKNIASNLTGGNNGNI